jgi:hypothetical protein
VLEKRNVEESLTILFLKRLKVPLNVHFIDGVIWFLDLAQGGPMKYSWSQAQVRTRLTSMIGTANPIQLAKLTGVALPYSVLSIPFRARLGPRHIGELKGQ